MASDDSAPTLNPGRPGLSFETYEKAYHELSGDDGTPPSQRQLRKYLGTGSNTTLASYRRRIAEERVIDGKPLEPASLDAELLATVQRLASQIALDEAQVADDRVDEIKTEADNRIRIAETTMEKRLQDTDVLEYRATQAEHELAKLRTTTKEDDAALALLATTHHNLKEEHAALTQALSDANRQIANQARELSLRESALELARTAEKEALQSAKRESDDQQKAYLTLQQALSKSKAELSVINETHAKLTQDFAERLKVIDAQNDQQRTLQARLNKSVELREETLMQLQTASKEREVVFAQCEKVTAELSSEKRLAQNVIDQMTQNLADKTTQIEHLQKTVTALSQASSKR